MTPLRNVLTTSIYFSKLNNITKMPKRSATSEGGNTTTKKQKVAKDSDERTCNKGIAAESKYVFFYGIKSPFSQFHPARFVVDGKTYNCMEQYMHHQKAVTFKDEVKAKQILASSDPKEHKKLGRKVRNFDKEVWNNLSEEIVEKGNEAKFSQNEELKKALFDTGDKVLAEASPRDRIWGIGLGASNPKAQNPKYWRGKNKLGYALTRVRAILRGKDIKIPKEH
ncbi:hypothetical protein CHS0354_042138 [Potamilus streckersoni]|uniref:NADAR domain-containing protein n=1 Tax=Potamilus streckersoni TaxID=2493646 RepID=A0AAE0WER9_9BIVA|nr:hypothetical protein CHS0354_042138 [Potamilus streckersoni]